MSTRLDLSFIITDNESTVQRSIKNGDYVQAFLLIHSLIESLLRVFFERTDLEDKSGVYDFINVYKEYLTQQEYPFPTFIDELTEFNKRRNRVVHQLWRKGYTYTNNKLKEEAGASVMLYSLFIEWLQTFDPELKNLGFKFSDENE